ncbi:MAG: class II aldolase/adducin family protein [Clostridiales bacterium]|nr:class II aldolase/adducin family protein [Bacillota bacterium]NLL55157.1 class II aldolase/adducin family protein [Clostridiales bacterium]
MDMNRAKEVQRAVCETSRKMYDSGLVAGTWGNIAARIDKDYMVVTPSGMKYEILNPDDMVIMNMHTYERDPDSRKPSIEFYMHAQLLLEHPDMNAVVHTHSTYALIMATARKPIPPVCDDQVQILGGAIPVAEYAMPGTPEMGAAVAAAMKEGNGVLVPNHGAVTIGRNLDEALLAAVLLEKTAQVYIGTMAVGGPVELDPADIAAMRDYFLNKYGQR